ncbi:hypothetical protein ZWY2020_027798 [Hordeum vulgare]|nr:hypothetical protein ZWY2020_027798 [Hordeum vulgare]
MASSRAIMLSLFVLALSHTVVQARMMPSDQPQMLAEKTIRPPPYSPSLDFLQVFLAPLPPMSVTFAGNIGITGAKRRRASQVVQGRFRARR